MTEPMYCISEAQLETLLAGCQNDYGEWCKGVDDAFGETIRSHPLSQELKAERERVLVDVKEAMLSSTDIRGDCMRDAIRVIKSLRSEQP